MPPICCTISLLPPEKRFRDTSFNSTGLHMLLELASIMISPCKEVMHSVKEVVWYKSFVSPITDLQLHEGWCYVTLDMDGLCDSGRCTSDSRYSL